MILKNIPFKDYLKLDENEAYIYTYSFKFGYFLNKKENYFGLKPIREYTLGQVKDAQSMIEVGILIGDIPKLIAVFSTSELKHIYAQGLVEVFQQLAWIKAQVEDIIEVERAALVRKLSEREIKAGLERFEVYGSYPQIKAVANAFNQTIEWARGVSYEDAFVELCYQKDSAEYQSDLMNTK